MSGEIRTPASPLPRQLKEKREARENAEKGIPTPVTPPATPVAPATPAPPIETPTPTPIASPATPEPVPPTPPPVPEPTPTPPPAPEPKPKEGIVPTAPPTKVPGKKDGETSDDALTRMSAAIKTLQGKYNAEVPGLMKENSRLVKENADLQSEHDKVKADNERLTREFDDFKKQSAQDQPKASAITDKEKEVATKLGIESDDFLALKNVILSGIPKPVEVKHEPTPKTVEKPVKESTLDQMTPAKRTYIETLDSLIGGWEVREEIVKDPKFAEFLSMFDGNSNKPIHELAREADDSLNSVRMAEVYTAFLDWKSAPPVSETKTPTSQLMPNPKGGGGDLKSNKKPIYTEQQYDDFQRAIKRGDYRTIGLNAEEAKKVIEAKAYWSEEFRTAKMEGRIVASQE